MGQGGSCRRRHSRLYQAGLQCVVFVVPTAQLRRAILGWETHDWLRDPFSRVAYSFTAAVLDNASEKLREPVRDTLFFAGEATADGEEVGSVHGAFASGLRVAKEVVPR